MTEQSLETLSFEQALKELESIVRLLERGDLALEEAMKYYERGMLLKTFCDRYLQEAQLKVEKIIETPGGQKREPLSFGD